MKRALFVGFDIGSDSVHYAVLDSEKNILHSPEPIPHKANPVKALRKAWQDVTSKFDEADVQSTSFTGSGAEAFKQRIPELAYDYDSVAIPKGARVINPETEAIFHLGAKDAYFFSLSNINGMTVTREAKQSSKCGGGSGTLVAKQCIRLLEDEVKQGNGEIFERAQEMARCSTAPSEFLARCGIVIQSDLIHHQNDGVSKADNLAGLFNVVARNYVIDTLGNKSPSSNHAIATGGVVENRLIREHLEKILGMSIQVPEHYKNVGAIGIAAKSIEEENHYLFYFDSETASIQSQRKFAPPLSEELERIDERHEDLVQEIEPGTEVVIGIDGGSTTTKGALVDVKTKRLLDKLYISTHGAPEAALKKVLSYLSRHKDRVVVRGVATTGSARQLYQRILVDQKKSRELRKQGVSLVDRVTDEITCHALGIHHHDSGVDVIYEIGGQDMKYTQFDEDGIVTEAEMNFSCQAGGGQTLENMAKMIGLDVKSTLQEEAIKAQRVPIIDSTCGVFMEMDLNRLIGEGFSKPELAAAIVRATADSYYNKFVGGASKTKGQRCSVQGGPALGRAFLAALSQVSRDNLNAYPHREMFGAWGAALDVINNITENKGQISQDTAFRGWEVIDMEFSKRNTTCSELSKASGKKKCKVRDCELEVYSIGDDEIVTGGFCPTGNSEAAAKPRTNYVDKFHDVFDRHFKRQGVLLEELASERDTIGIRRCTSTIGEKGIWSAALLANLGFVPVATPKSNHEIARVGIDNSRTGFCIARKLAKGHAITLQQHPGIQYSFNPSIVHHVQEHFPLKYCIYTESEGFIFKHILDPMRMINPIIEFGDEDSIVETFYSELKRIGRKVPKRKIRQAIQKAEQAEQEFNHDIAQEGEKFLDKVKGKKAYIGIGRDYVLLDPEASSHSGTMFAQTRGLDYIPQPFLAHRFRGISLDSLAPDEYWHENMDILKAQLYVTQNPGLYPIRMMNFGCGPDSMKIYQEVAIQRKAKRPLLKLLTDGQANNAPFVTRTEAFERVVEQHSRRN